MTNFFVKNDELRVGRIIGVVAAALLIAILLLTSIAKVPTGHTGVITTFGRVENYTFDSGVHFKAPWQRVIKMDNRIQKNSIALSCFSSDIQEVNITYTVNYQISKADAMTIYSNIGRNYFDTVVAPNISEAVKVSTAKYTAESLVNDRSSLATDIENILTELLSRYNIEVVGTSIEDLDFTDAFTNAVEAKQVAAQNKLKAETEQAQKTMEQQASAERAIIAAEAEARQAIIAANADLEVVQIQAEASLYAGQREAEMNQRIAESLTPNLIKYYWIKQWSGQLPTTMLDDNANVMLNFQ